MERWRVWLVTLPLVAAGTEAASSIVDAFAPRRYETAELFSRSNASHALLPLIATLGAGLALWAIFSLAKNAPSVRHLPRVLFACLPLLAFALQEHVEYVVAHGSVAWTLFADPVFLVGLLLQIPMAIAMYLLARLLLEVAVAIAERTARPLLRPDVTATRSAAAGTLARLQLRDSRRRTRAPPHLSLA